MPDVPTYQIRRFKEKSASYCLTAIVWNEGERIRAQIERMASWAELVDVVIIDGGSDDGSLENVHLQNHRTTALVTVDEPGLGTAVRAAIAFSLAENYQGLITIDGNGKDDLAALPEILAALQSGVGLVQGSRFLPGGFHHHTPLERLLGIRWLVAPLISFRAGVRVTDPTNGFRGLSREYLIDPRLQPLRSRFVGFALQLYLVFRSEALGHGFQEIPVGRSYPENGTIPTKIIGFKPRLSFLGALIRVVTRLENPKA